MRKRICLGFLLVFSAMLVFTGYAFFKTVQKSEEIIFHDIRIETLQDGTYQGECDSFLVKAKVEVTIKDAKLHEIQLLEHQQGMGSQAESILDDMVNNNSTSVDCVSGATVSSKVLRCAIENALK